MTRVLEPTTTPDAIVFELERFEPAEGRLELSGRWFGVRGRRFVRPTLTAALASGRIRALADLDHKPWAAEDGEPWTASFPWDSDRRPAVSELSVAPDITIQLPAPRARRGRAERLPAVPRREAMTASWGDVASSVETEPRGVRPAPSAAAPDLAKAEPESPAVEPDPRKAAPESPMAGPESSEAEPESGKAEPESSEAEPESPKAGPVSSRHAIVEAAAPPAELAPRVLAAELEALRVQLEEAGESLAGSQAELENMRQELAPLRSEIEDARLRLSLQDQELEDAQAKLSSAQTAREAALRSAAQAESEREVALSQAAEAQAERDTLAADQLRLTATLEQVQRRFDLLKNERDQAVASRGAALVMRGATRALPAHEHHVGWLRRSVVLLVLIGVVFAALIVLHAL